MLESIGGHIEIDQGSLERCHPSMVLEKLADGSGRTVDQWAPCVARVRPVSVMSETAVHREDGLILLTQKDKHHEEKTEAAARGRPADAEGGIGWTVVHKRQTRRKNLIPRRIDTYRRLLPTFLRGSCRPLLEL